MKIFPTELKNDLIPRDWIAGAFLFLATAGVVLWQNAHVAVLFDLSYILNTATRIAQGQMPYRDFPLAHAPLTFLIQALIIRLTGRVIVHHIIYVAVVGGLGTVLTWRVALGILRGQLRAAWPIALLLALPIIFLGVYSIVPNPEYDCDCGFWIVVGIWMLQKLDSRTSAFFGFLTGAVICIPVFFKQNMGLPFLAVALGAIALLILMNWFGRIREAEVAPRSSTLCWVLTGSAVTMISALLALHWTAGLGYYIQWTIRYAAHRRLPGSGDMLSVYSDTWLLWMVPCIAAGLLVLRSSYGKKRSWQMSALALLSAPFLVTLVSMFVYSDADTRGDRLLALWPMVLLIAAALSVVNLIGLRRERSIRALLPIIVLAAIHGTFMSQQLWGSTYGIWPLLAILMAEVLCFAAGREADEKPTWLLPALSAVISATLLVCGALYTTSEERLSYAYLPDGPPAHSAFPQLAGLATPGPYLPEIDELLRYAAANIPFQDGIVLLPGEEPFYFATNRESQFPVPFFDPTIDPYTTAEVAELVKTRDIRWLVVKHDIQTKVNPVPDAEELTKALVGEFSPVAHLRGYDIYHR